MEKVVDKRDIREDFFDTKLLDVTQEQKENATIIIFEVLSKYLTTHQ